MSPDGRILVGEVNEGKHLGPEQPAVWTDGVLRVLKHPEGGNAVANAISADGHVVAGRAGSPTTPTGAALWVDGWISLLSDVPGGSGAGEARAVSANGSVVVGYGNANAGNTTAARWVNGAVEALPTLGTGVTSSAAWDVSGDGSRIAGFSHHGRFDDALLWENGVPISLGHLPGGDFAIAKRISEDGTLVFGDADDAGNDDQIFVWDALNGMRSIRGLLEGAGVDLHGWESLSQVIDISGDGKTILGYGYDARGFYSPFIATIPEPATLTLAVVSFVLPGLRLRRESSLYSNSETDAVRKAGSAGASPSRIRGARRPSESAARPGAVAASAER